MALILRRPKAVSKGEGLFAGEGGFAFRHALHAPLEAAVFLGRA
jgi:hypothetical protein